MGQTVDSSEQALAGPRELYEAVVQAIGAGVVVQSAVGECLFADEEAARLLGFAAAGELLGASREAVSARLGLLRAGSEGGRPWSVDVHDGDELRHVVTFLPIDDLPETLRPPHAGRDELLDREAKRSSALLDSLYAGAPIGLGFWDRDLRYVRVNDALARINERSPEAHVGRSFAEVVPQLADVIEPIARRVLETGEPVTALQLSAGTPNDPAAERDWLASYYPVLAPDGEPLGVGAVIEEVTQRRRAERRSDLQHAVTRVLTAAESVDDAVPAVLRAVCETVGWDIGCYWSLDPETPRLTWVRPGLQADEFMAFTEGAELTAGLLPGRVAAAAEAEWLEELPADRFVRAGSAATAGLCCGVAFPVVIGGRVAGVLELFSRARRERDEDLLRALDALGNQVGQFLRRKRAEDERAQMLERERAARADAEAAAVDNAKLFQEAERSRDRLGFLAEAGALLGASLDVEATLEQLGSLVAGRAADWCTIHLADDDGARLVTVSQRDSGCAERARDTLSQLRPVPGSAGGVGHVIATGRPELHPYVAPEALDGPAREVGVHSVLIVPLVARGRTLGAMSWAWAETERSYDAADLDLALDLAARAAVAIDNAQLYREAEERAQAARVLDSVGDGVFLVDRHGVVRTWNRTAAVVTGLQPAEVIDRGALEAIPGWAAVVSRVPVAAAGTSGPRAESLPLDLGERELWLSLHGVAVPDGVVYAFRDLTDERALEIMRTEFVSTVSHELRTPLAAIYGAAMTLRRTDVELDDEQRARMLEVVSGEADRLARTVNDILWASRLDAGSLHVTISSCDPAALVHDVLEAQRAHLDRSHELTMTAEPGLPEVAGDPDKVGRVLINLVDNAIKYSPDGGRVHVRLRRVGGHVRLSVSDPGLGIPSAEQRRVFEKFYRLDPNMTRGVGGTGLGLYICRELVRRMDGRIWVDSGGLGRGSTFHIELPVSDL